MEAASFSTSIDSISSGFIAASGLVFIPPLLPPIKLSLIIGIPSTTYNGSPPAEIEAIPRILTKDAEPASPEPVVTETPAACPCNADSKLGTGSAAISFPSTLAMAPVTSLFRCTP